MAVHGDFHAAMTDGMLMTWLEKRLTPALKQVFGNKKISMVLTNALCLQVAIVIVNVPEANIKEFNTNKLAQARP